MSRQVMRTPSPARATANNLALPLQVEHPLQHHEVGLGNLNSTTDYEQKIRVNAAQPHPRPPTRFVFHECSPERRKPLPLQATASVLIVDVQRQM